MGSTEKEIDRKYGGERGGRHAANGPRLVIEPRATTSRTISSAQCAQALPTEPPRAPVIKLLMEYFMVPSITSSYSDSGAAKQPQTFTPSFSVGRMFFLLNATLASPSERLTIVSSTQSIFTKSLRTIKRFFGKCETAA